MERFERWPVLARINSPADVKALPAEQLPRLADEIRDYLVYRVGENGGHLASNLGVVELTLAIHRVFDAPHDRIVFDVGHQSYVHKLLTGRKEQFDTLRCAGGISGFTKRAESEYDAFGAGHSSTSVSAAIGLAEAEKLRGGENFVVAVIGDGALSGGLAYEGLNNCARNLKLILIINENEMSISPNTGRLATHLSKLRASRTYLKTKEFSSGAVRHIPLLGKPVYRILRKFKRFLKHRLYRENLFEHMGIRYLGPVCGNDTEDLEACLRHAKNLDCSVILHVKTKKGSGYAPAEADPNRYHSLPPRGASAPAQTFSGVFGRELCALAEENSDICAITAAMSCGTGLEPFRHAHPKRFFDVGIAEGHAATFAAGLSAGGMRPVMAVYSTFLQRAFDNVLHDAALQRLSMVLAVDRAGLNAGDGPTHHGIFDVAMLGAVPHTRIYAPVTFEGLRRMLRAALSATDEVVAIRYPHGGEDPRVASAFYPNGEEGHIGVRTFGASREEADLTLVTHGRVAAEALAAVDKLSQCGKRPRILLCEYLAPYDELAREVAPLLGRGGVIFIEEEIRAGGFGVSLSDALLRTGALAENDFCILAAEREFITPAAGESVFAAAGVDATSILRAAKTLLEKEK